jgi:probable F420-dependent oxidoreductase
MKIGVVFPQIEFPPDPIAVRDYAQAVEGMGYTHIYIYDHILGANPDRPGGWRGPYTYENPFFEPFAFYSYLAGLTTRIGFATGIVILPQRQTALVAKQAATLDVLSHGRLRLGVALGWNEVEYLAQGENFHNRGKRLEEQVQLLRLLWTQPLVKFEGRYHHIADAGINPLPLQRPIPIWIGGSVDAALRRIARIGDGWMANVRTIEQARPAVEKLNQYLEGAGRDRASFGIDARLNASLIIKENWINFVKLWEELGATHLSINTMSCGYETPSAHITALKEFARVMGLS